MAYQKLSYKRTGVEFVVSDFEPYRKKPCLFIAEGNTWTKLASFNNDEAAEMFNKKFQKMMEIEED